MRILMRDSLIQATCMQAIEHNIWYNLVYLSRGRLGQATNKNAKADVIYMYKRQMEYHALCFLCLCRFSCNAAPLRGSSTTKSGGLERQPEGVKELHPTKEMKWGIDSDLVFEVGPDPMHHNPMCWIEAAPAHGELSGGDGMAAAFASPARHA